jgi:hypothetical protein
MNLVFGVRGKLTHVESEKAVKLAFYCKPIAELFAQTFGRYSRTRSLPLGFGISLMIYWWAWYGDIGMAMEAKETNSTNSRLHRQHWQDRYELSCSV